MVWLGATRSLEPQTPQQTWQQPPQYQQQLLRSGLKKLDDIIFDKAYHALWSAEPENKPAIARSVYQDILDYAKLKNMSYDQALDDLDINYDIRNMIKNNL